MEIKILKDTKNEIELQLDNITIAEILRTYLNKDSDVSLAAWRREQYERPVIFKVKTKGKTAKKAIDDAISTIEKETDKLINDFKKAK